MGIIVISKKNLSTKNTNNSQNYNCAINCVLPIIYTCKTGGGDNALVAEEEALEELFLAPFLLLG